MGRFYSLNDFFKQEFGEKIYKVSLDGGFDCPNRDGKAGYGGCTFCSEDGSGEHAGDRRKSIYEQIEEQLEQISRKFPEGKVMAYFQNFTNTYAEPEYLRELWEEALSHPRVMGLAIATRPDCLGEPVLELLDEFNKKTFLWVELGLQTVNEEAAKFFNRGYELPCFDAAAKNLRERGIKFVTHVLIGLPKTSETDGLETALYAEKAGSWGLKIHCLYITKNTAMERLYRRGIFQAQTKEQFIEKVLSILENISYNTVVHRLTGDGDKETLVAPLWSLNKRDVLNSIQKALKAREEQKV